MLSKIDTLRRYLLFDLRLQLPPDSPRGPSGCPASQSESHSSVSFTLKYYEHWGRNKLTEDVVTTT